MAEPRAISTGTKERIKGYDLARALAIFGMVIVNFKIVMSATTGSQTLISLASLLEGRAAATFVVLAGVGITMMTNSARKSGDQKQISQVRRTLFKRSLLLVGIGLLYTPIWPADILHFYGFYIAIGAILITYRNKILWICTITFPLIFMLIFLVADYEQGWNWTTLEYSDFWTLKGMFRHIFFNGFHPVFPWTAFLFIGMWLGRQPISQTRTRRKIMGIAALIWAGTEFISYQLTSYMLANPINDSSISPENLQLLLGTRPMPPFPQYILASGGLAVLVIMLCISISMKFSKAVWLEPLYYTGQISLTLYVAHVIIGMGTLEYFGKLYNQSIGFALMWALLFNLLSVVFAVVWKRFFSAGPLEWCFRAIAGPRQRGKTSKSKKT